MIPRDFFIEERLEKFRLKVSCNLGESGLKNFSLRQVLQKLKIPIDKLGEISLADSPNNGREDLRIKIASLYQNVAPDEVLVTSGTSEALYIFFHLLLEKNDVVSLFTPAFQALYEIPKTLGAEIREVEVIDSLPVDNLFSRKTKLAIINHPHNPTGIGLTKKEIEKIKESISTFEGYTLFDEHYRFLEYENDLTYSGAGLGERVFATGSITKCFGVTGLRIGWIIGNKEFLSRARSFKDYLTHTVNPISEFLTLEILKNRKSFIQPIKESIVQNIKYFKLNARELPGVEFFRPPDGGLVSFAKLKPGISSEVYADALLNQCDIFVLPGVNFEREGFIRIGFGEESELFQQGIDRWKSLKI